jgi:hypothetical protein
MYTIQKNKEQKGQSREGSRERREREYVFVSNLLLVVAVHHIHRAFHTVADPPVYQIEFTISDALPIRKTSSPRKEQYKNYKGQTKGTV